MHYTGTVNGAGGNFTCIEIAGHLYISTKATIAIINSKTVDRIYRAADSHVFTCIEIAGYLYITTKATVAIPHPQTVGWICQPANTHILGGSKCCTPDLPPTINIL